MISIYIKRSLTVLVWTILLFVFAPAEMPWAVYADGKRVLGTNETEDGFLNKEILVPRSTMSSNDYDPLESTRNIIAVIQSMTYLAQTEQKGSYVTIRSEADVRHVPDISENRFALAAKGARAKVLMIRDEWIRVTFDNGSEGWIPISQTNIAQSIQENEDTIDIRNNFVRTALASRGVPYVWGGTSTNGYDCSGLILDITRRFGIRMPRTAAQQWERGLPVGRDKLKPGDLVFFANTYRSGTSHVGIYIGDQKFVHASSGQGMVTVNSLLEEYYQRKYIGARRLSLNSEH